MKIAVKTRLALVAGLLALAAYAALPGSASAANFTCKGHTKLGTATADAENPLDYKFACTARIVGFTLVSDRELDYFEPELEVTDTAGTVIGSDGFACEGDFPGYGINCLGTYGTNRFVDGTISLNGQEACAEPRATFQLVVVGETLDAVTNAPKKTSTGTMAGPFELGRPRGCPASSELAGVLALVAELRKDLAEPAAGDPLG